MLTLSARQIVYDCRNIGEIAWGGIVHELLGYDPEEMLGGLEQWAKSIHHEDRPSARARVDAAESHCKEFALEYPAQWCPLC